MILWQLLYWLCSWADFFLVFLVNVNVIFVAFSPVLLLLYNCWGFSFMKWNNTQKEANVTWYILIYLEFLFLIWTVLFWEMRWRWGGLVWIKDFLNHKGKSQGKVFEKITWLFSKILLNNFMRLPRTYSQN